MPKMKLVRYGCCMGIKAEEHKHHHHHHHHRKRCEERCAPQAYMIYPVMPMTGGPVCGQGSYENPAYGANPMDWME